MHWVIKEWQDISKLIKKSNLSSFAASTAFFLILSLVPIAILICAVIPYTNISMDSFIEFLGNMLPSYIVTLCSNIIYEFNNGRVALISATAVITLWAAGKGVFALISGLNSVNEVEEKRNWFLLRLLGSVSIIVVIAGLLLSLVIIVYGNKINQAIIAVIPTFQYLYSFVLQFRFVMFLILYALLFMFLYAFMPCRKMVVKQQFPGALFASISWAIFSWAFSIYVDWFDGFSNYGSLTTLIIAMFWLYFCMYIVLLGAIINVKWSDFEAHHAKSKQKRMEYKAKRMENKAKQKAVRNEKKFRNSNTNELVQETVNEASHGLEQNPQGMEQNLHSLEQNP